MKKPLIAMLAACMLLAACSSAQAPTQTAAEPTLVSTIEATTSAAPSPPAAPTVDATPEPTATPTPEPKDMSAQSAGIVEGKMDDRYGMRGAQQAGGVPTLSLPLSITDAPEGTVCFALRMLDPDSVPLAGYAWVHWLAANYATAEWAENASIDSAADMVQGKNDFGKTGYGGPTPPNKPHTYAFTVYALDAPLDLKNGFSQKDFDKALEGHILAEAQFTGEYAN